MKVDNVLFSFINNNNYIKNSKTRYDVVHKTRSIMGNVVAYLVNGNPCFKFNNAALTSTVIIY